MDHCVRENVFTGTCAPITAGAPRTDAANGPLASSYPLRDAFLIEDRKYMKTVGASGEPILELCF
jgi:hypothetical protein